LKLQKLSDVHGQNHEELFRVKELFDGAIGNLSAHMKKEELLLFPYIAKMVKYKNERKENSNDFGGVELSIENMLEEHQTEGDRFKLISEITRQYTVPADGCSTYQVTYKMLEEFEDDLHRHIHLENNILFPKAVLLENELLNN
jgi:regulator of cell morphogenesis and NO signaling